MSKPKLTVFPVALLLSLVFLGDIASAQSNRLSRMRRGGLSSRIAKQKSSARIANVMAKARALKKKGRTALQAASDLRRSGFSAAEIGVPLARIYRVPVSRMSRVFRSARIRFNPTLQISMLKNLGSTVQQIAAALKPGRTATQVATLLKNSGYGVVDVARGIASAYGLSPNALAQALKAAGYNATDIARALREVMGQDSGQVRTVLQNLGFTQLQIAAAMRVVFNIQGYVTVG